MNAWHVVSAPNVNSAVTVEKSNEMNPQALLHFTLTTKQFTQLHLVTVHVLVTVCSDFSKLDAHRSRSDFSKLDAHWSLGCKPSAHNYSIAPRPSNFELFPPLK